MSKEEVKKSEETKTETPATPAPEAAAAPAPEAPKPALAPGLFQGFTLGSSLKQGPTGNVMANTKKPIMDYEKTYKESTRNEQLSPEQFKAQQEAKAKKS